VSRGDLAKEKLENLTAEIRKQSGFEYFLLPPSEEEIRAAAKDGMIVVIIASHYNGNAIIVDQYQIRCLHIDHVDSDEIEQKLLEGHLGSRKILEWLWDAIMNPILKDLGFTEPLSNEKWPQV
jgi:hypothetical protein